MVKVISMSDYQYDLTINHAGPTMAISEEDDIIVNHQTCYTNKLIPIDLTQEQEAEALKSLLEGKGVLLSISVLGMFQYVDTWDELLDLDDEDWFLAGKVLDVQPGQLRIASEEEGTKWLALKHIDVIEIGGTFGDDPFEYESEE